MKRESGLTVARNGYRSLKVICKQCKKYPRANGSSRCQACTAEFHIINEQERKLQRKVEAQVKINK